MKSATSNLPQSSSTQLRSAVLAPCDDALLTVRLAGRLNRFRAPLGFLRAFRSVSLLALLLAASASQGQVEVIDNFNNNISPAPGWGNYDPGSGLGQINTRSKVENPPASGNYGYRQQSPGTTCASAP